MKHPRHMPPGWRFYGREAELADLGRALRWHTFIANRIQGRRGVGKSELPAVGPPAIRRCWRWPANRVFWTIRAAS